MEKLILLLVGFVAFTGLSDGVGLLPDTMTAAEGRKVMFTTVSPPDGPFRLIIWSFGDKTIIVGNPDPGNPLPGYEGRVTLFPDTGSLELRSLSLNDSGEYSVRITPTAGNERTGTTTLEVVELIEGVTASANSTDVLESSSVRLSCSVSSGSSLTLVWKNGSSEVTADDRVQLNDDNTTLTITNVLRYDQATYTCNVSNPFSSGTSDEVKLSVSYGPENTKLTLPPPGGPYASGSDITMSCSADSRPEAQYAWYKNVTKLPDTGSELTLTNIQIGDSGEYSCETFNTKTMKSEKSQPASVSVIERISNSSITTTNVAMEGKHFNLTCDADGSMLTRKWLKDGSDLTLSDNITLDDDNRVLSFQPLNRANRGVYSCNITNPISTMEAKYTVVVNYGPDKAQIEGESKINTGETFTLTCSAESEPSASFTWVLNGKEVHNSAEYKKKAEPSDAGNYTCQAKNSKTGRSSSAMHGLTVIEKKHNPCGGGCIAGIIIAVLVVIGAAVGGYFLYKKKKSPNRSLTPRGGRDGGEDNTGDSGNKELNYADIRAFHKKDGDSVQLGTQNEATVYSQVRGSNNPPAAASLPDYDAHMQRNRGLAPQPEANGAQLYSQIRKK